MEVNQIFLVIPSALSAIATIVSAFVASKIYSLNKKISEKEEDRNQHTKIVSYNNCIIILELKKSLIKNNIEFLNEKIYTKLFKIKSDDFNPIIDAIINYPLNRDIMPELRDIIITSKMMNMEFDNIQELNEKRNKINEKEFTPTTNKEAFYRIEKEFTQMANSNALKNIDKQLKKEYLQLKNYMIDLEEMINNIQNNFLKETEKHENSWNN